MKRAYLHLGALLFLTMILSCAKDWDGMGLGNGQVGSSEVVLRIKTPSGFSSGAASRALTVEDEYKIENIWVLAFNAAGNLTEVRQGENLTDIDASTRSFTATLQRSQNTTDTYNLMVLANAEDIIRTTIGVDLDNIADKSYGAVTALLNKRISSKMYASGGSIPMWGESGALEIKLGANRNIALSMLRSVARIDIGVGLPVQGSDGTYSWTGKDDKGNQIPFELKEVYVVKANNSYATVPNKAYVAEGKVTEPTVPTDATPFTLEESIANFKYADTEITASSAGHGSYTTQSIYIPEADVKIQQSAKSGDEKHEERMAIVVGGDYNNSGRTTYYRLDLAKDGEILNALRNHLYQFNISKVSGFGYADVETAYRSLSLNMQVEILNWNEAEMSDVVFDGQHYFSISKRKVEFSPMGGETETVTIKTNVTMLELWEERGGDEYMEMKLGGITTYTNDDMGYKYTLTTVVAGSEYNLKIEATKHNVSNAVPDRLDKWRIKANRLNAAFEVDQQYTVLYVSYINGQSQNLYPEGTLANTIPIDIMALKPVDIKTEDSGSSASWIKLGNTDGLTTGDNGLYQARLNVEVDPFVYSSGVSTIRTGTIIVTPQGETPRVFTITQESPVFKFAKTSETVTRKTGTIYHTYVDVITNLPETDFSVAEKAPSGTDAWRITHKGVFYNVDKTNPRSRRFDVDVDMDTNTPMNAEAFSKSFSATIDQKYGTLSPIDIKFEVIAGNNYFDWFWRNAVIPPLPYKFPTDDDNSAKYIFPWQTESVTIDFNSNNGLKYDDTHSSNTPHKGGLVAGQAVDKGDYIVTPFTFTFNKANYNVADYYKLYFKSTTSTTTLNKSLEMGLGLQMWKRTTSASAVNMSYKGTTVNSPYNLTVTSNVQWRADVASASANYVQMRPSASEAWASPQIKRDDRVSAPEVISNYNTETHLVKSSVMGIAVMPYNQLNATPSPREIDVQFTNESFSSSKGGLSIADKTLKLKQYAPTLECVSGVPDSSIEYYGDSYTITANTNIQSWGVRVYIGNDNKGTKLVDKTFGSSPTISSMNPTDHTVTVSIPRYNNTTDRQLSFYLYHSLTDVPTKEVKIKTVTQSYVNYVTINGVTWTRGNLIAEGNNDCIIGSPSDAGLFFQFGSLIGWTGGANGDGIGSSSSTTLDKRVWPSIMGPKPSYSWTKKEGASISTLSDHYFNYTSSPWANQNINSHIGDFNLSISGDAGSGTLASGRYARLGVGDPCSYYLGDQWRLPTGAEIKALGNNNPSSWQKHLGMNGRWFGSNSGNSTTSIFLPAVGHRYPDDGRFHEVGREARCGSASIYSTTHHYYMFNNSSGLIQPDVNSSRASGLPIRCVRK